MIEVEAPDGSVVEFPDDTPRDVMTNAMRQRFGGSPATAQPAVATPPAGSEQEGFLSRAGRNLVTGSQGAAEGLAANVLGMPVDAATALVVNPVIYAKNKLFGGETPFVTEPLGGSAGLKRGVREGIEALGGEAADPEKMPFLERSVFEAVGAATGALTGGVGLARRGAQIAMEAGKRRLGSSILPSAIDSVAAPYAQNATAALSRDIAGGFGSGIGLAGAKELPDEVRDLGGGILGVGADMAGSIFGGAGGMGALAVGQGAAKQLQTLAGKPFGLSYDKTVPVEQRGDAAYTHRAADMAAEVYQGVTTNKSAAPPMLADNRAQLEPVLGHRMPTSGALAEDPGLVALERQMAMADPNPMIRRDQDLNAGVRDVIDSAAPQGADPQALVAAARDEAARMRGEATAQAEQLVAGRQQRVDTVRGRADAVDGIRREDAAPLGPYQSADAKVGASKRLDEALVDQTYLPDRARKNELYDAVDPNRTEQVDAQPLIDAARQVRERVNTLGPQGQQLPAEFVQRIERLAPDVEQQPSGVLGPDGQPLTREVNSGGDGRAAVGDIVDLQKYTGAAREAARRSGNFDLADNIGELRRGGSAAIEGSPAAAEANTNYRESFAPKYRAGPGDEMAGFTKQIDRDPTRSTTPPSETAGRFLAGPEKVATLRRVLDSSPAAEGGNAAVRDYLLSDMAQSGVIDQKTGALRPDRLRAWRNSYGEGLNAAPGFAGEVDAMLARAQKGERLSGGLAQQVKGAEDQLRRTATEAGRSVAEVDNQINKGALGMVLDADPDKTVSAIMSNQNRSGRMLDDLVKLTGNDEQARAGLKAAVRDYLVEKGSTTATEKLPAGDPRQPLSFAKTQKLFKEHEQQMAAIFSPEEMNSLRVVHKALELQNTERVRVRSGSDTAEKLLSNGVDDFLGTPAGRATEAVLRVKFGMLKGGGMIAMGRRFLSGLTPEDGRRAHELLQRAAFDPDLAMILATRKVPPGSPAYNAAIQKALAAGAGARAALEDE